MKKRGRKRADHDLACPNQDCDVHGIVNNENVIRHGRQKTGEQEYTCNRCGTRFNRRKGTPLEGIRTPIYLVLLAMALHTCGMGVAMIAVVTGKQERTVGRWIRRIAPHRERRITQELSNQFYWICLRIPAQLLNPM